MEIIGSGTYGCVYFPGFNCKGKPGKKQTDMVSKITTDNIGVNSEYNIGQIIKTKMKNYKNFFLIVEKKCTIYKGSLNNYVKSSCHLVDNKHKKYFVLHSPYIDGHDLLEFYSMDLKNSKNINKFYTNFFHYYDVLCNALKHLKNMKIVHFDLSLKNIRVDVSRNRPLIIDFGMSFIIDKLILQENMSGMVTKFNLELILTYFSINPISSPKYCFEIQVICFAVLNYGKNMEAILDTAKFTEFIKKYYTTNQLFSLFSNDFKDKYIESVYSIYSVFIGRPIKYIVLQCLSTWKTWDSFNLHFHFLSLLYNLNDFTPLILDIMNVSMMQIHSNPNRRLTCEKVIEKYNSIIKSSDSDRIIQYMSSIESLNIKKIRRDFHNSYTTLFT